MIYYLNELFCAVIFIEEIRLRLMKAVQIACFWKYQPGAYLYRYWRIQVVNPGI